ncbi:MAG: Hsp20/alpha crystallin family protein [Bdellovibrionales bacterium]|nr:Hsp20/alpha crystallin family protein [Bdellovibrionales bacterium]
MRYLSPRRNSLDDVFFRDLDSAFNELWNNAPRSNKEWSFSPTMDIKEAEGHYLASFDLPGMNDSDISIDVKGNHLVVSGERKEESKKEEETGRFTHYERRFGQFKRIFTLPDAVNKEAIEAHYDKGVLQILIPKVEEKADKKIEVKTGQQEGFFKRLLDKH